MFPLFRCHPAGRPVAEARLRRALAYFGGLPCPPWTP